jgi:hypothetical protein
LLEHLTVCTSVGRFKENCPGVDAYTNTTDYSQFFGVPRNGSGDSVGSYTDLYTMQVQTYASNAVLTFSDSAMSFTSSMASLSDDGSWTGVGAHLHTRGAAPKTFHM